MAEVRHPTVYIRWLDHSSYSDQSWRYIDDLELKPIVCHTVGILVKETDDAYYTALTISEEGQFTGIMCILKTCVEEKTDLAITRERRQPKKRTQSKT